MSSNSTLAQWQTFLSGQPSPLNIQAYPDSPAIPYGGSYPYLIILPRTQHQVPMEAGGMAWQGWWRLIYVDTADQEGDSLTTMFGRVRTFTETLAATLGASYNNRCLGSTATIAFAGWAEDGSGGIVVDWDGKYRGLDANTIPFWAVPMDIFVCEQPEGLI